MSFENDITQIRKLTEADEIFKAANPDNIEARKSARHKAAKAFIQNSLKHGPPWTGTANGVCPFCGEDDLEWSERQDDNEYRTEWFNCGVCGADVKEHSYIEYQSSEVEEYPDGYVPVGGVAEAAEGQPEAQVTLKPASTENLSNRTAQGLREEADEIRTRIIEKPTLARMIENRRSYETLSKFLVVARRNDTVATLMALHALLDSMHAYGTATNSGYARESLIYLLDKEGLLK